MRIGEWLRRHGMISQEQLTDVLKQQASDTHPARLGQILIKEGLVTEADVLRGIADQYHCDFIERVSDTMLDPELVARLPLDYARSRVILPVRYRECLALLTDDPGEMVEHGDLALLLGEEPVPLLTTRDEVLRCIEACYYRRQDSTEDLLRNLEGSEGAEAFSGSEVEDLLRSADQAPAAQWVNVLLLESLKAGASDVHIEPFGHELKVRFRIDGVLYEHTAPPKQMETALISRIKIMARMDIAEKRLPQDGMARVRLGDRDVDIRVSTVPVAEGERVVLRLLRHDTGLVSLRDLGMNPDLLARFQQLLEAPHGVVWVTGPTGSGKTTTLYAALSKMDTARSNILTIQDPVEYQLEGVGQIAVKPKIGLNFAQGLRHVLRQDPDVILVGETRDPETAEIVVRASLTGHLVFSTLHTNDALGAVTRLVDMHIPSYLVADSTLAALAQRLVRQLCPHCRAPYTPEPDEVAACGPVYKPLAGKSLFKPVGCDFCREGYTGRIGIYELVELNAAMREAIRTGQPRSEWIRCAERVPGFSMVEDGLAKVSDGLTSLEELAHVLGPDPAAGASA